MSTGIRKRTWLWYDIKRQVDAERLLKVTQSRTPLMSRPKAKRIKRQSGQKWVKGTTNLMNPIPIWCPIPLYVAASNAEIFCGKTHYDRNQSQRQYTSRDHQGKTHCVRQSHAILNGRTHSLCISQWYPIKELHGISQWRSWYISDAHIM